MAELLRGRNMYSRFEEWLDDILNTELPEEIVAFNFNLYEEEDDFWSIELAGASRFDEEDDDWACDEVFDSREYPLKWQEASSWENIHGKIKSYIRQYLVTGRYADLLKKYQGIAMGFVEGDLNIIYKSEINTSAMKNT